RRLSAINTLRQADGRAGLRNKRSRHAFTGVGQILCGDRSNAGGRIESRRLVPSLRGRAVVLRALIIVEKGEEMVIPYRPAKASSFVVGAGFVLVQSACGRRPRLVRAQAIPALICIEPRP